MTRAFQYSTSHIGAIEFKSLLLLIAEPYCYRRPHLCPRCNSLHSSIPIKPKQYYYNHATIPI